MESQLQIYSIVSILGYVLAALFLVASVAIFFLMDIKGVYAYLSGKKQQKGIMEMREKQQDIGKGKSVSESVRLGFSPPSKPESKKINNKPMAPVSSEKSAPQVQEAYSNETVNLQSQQPESYSDATDILSNANIETINNSTNASVDMPTDVLNAANVNVGTFTIIKNVMEIHTSQVL